MSLIINPYRFAATGVTPVLDTYGSAAAAYSVRKVRTAYTGSCLRVRRSNDNTESDIGFDGSGNLDESALTSFVGANSGYVTKWYDQSSNAQDVFVDDSSKQPRIVNASTVDSLSGKPAIYFGGNHYFINFGLPSVLTGEDIPLSMFVVDKNNSTNNSLAYPIGLYLGRYRDSEDPPYQGWFTYTFNIDGVGSFDYIKQDDADYYRDSAITGSFTGTSRKLFQLTDSGTSANIFLNDRSAAELSSFNSNVGYMSLEVATIGAGIYYTGTFPVNYLTGYIQEIIIYASNKSSDRTGIRDNINTYFGVY